MIDKKSELVSRRCGVKTCWLIALLCGGLLPLGLAEADEVVMKDGSRVMGEILGLAGGKLTVETGFAGKITIDTAEVAGLTTEKEMMVGLDTGAQVPGKFTYTPDGGQKMTSATFGEAPIEVDKLLAVGAAGEPLFKPKSERSGSVELGLNGQTGNSERAAFLGRLETRHESDDRRTLFFLQGRRARENSVDSANEIIGGGRLEHDRSERLFTYISGELEMDEFEDLDLRATFVVGAGRYFWKEDTRSFRVRGGIGYQHESFGTGMSNDDAILDLGYDYMKHVAPWLLFNHGLTYQPTLGDAGDYRLIADTGGIIPLEGTDSWKIKVGMRNEYNSKIAPTVTDRLDTYYYINLVYDLFK